MSQGPAPHSSPSSEGDRSDKSLDQASLAAGDALPPVEPPDAGFILKLFIIPAIIVMIVVGVVMVFNQLAHMGSNPAAYVADIERGAQNSWQRAHDLTHELRSNSDARQDPELAKRLARLLDRMLAEPIKTGVGAENDARIRVFLCKALGEFEIEEGMPSLITAARPRTGAAADNEFELDVRRSALEAIAVRVSKIRKQGGDLDPEPAVQAFCVATAAGENPYVRYTGAFGLGVVGGDEAIARLKKLLDDVDPSTRYNAATGLARYGEVECIPVLAEMLDPEESAGLEINATARQGMSPGELNQTREFTQAQIVKNALRAAKLLAETNPQADLSPLLAQIEKLLNQDTFPGATLEIRDTQRTLEALAAKNS